ncbi:hypothetical protein FJZ22_02575 [Candidatus Pacearchaeota archaeon]|nr:hypothetical protein [Candidatus Pacearchaeota archaeon]
MEELKKEPWLKESARDLLALGSLAIGLALVARSTLGGYWNFVYWVLFSFIVLFGLSFIIKDYERHLARGITLLFFTILFYKADSDITFLAIFLSILFIVMIASAFYLKKDTRTIVRGIFMGVFATALSYYISLPLARLLGLPF